MDKNENENIQNSFHFSCRCVRNDGNGGGGGGDGCVCCYLMDYNANNDNGMERQQIIIASSQPGQIIKNERNERRSSTI